MSQGQNRLQYILNTISLDENKDINNWAIEYASENTDIVCVVQCRNFFESNHYLA